uniref:zinc fingers and homeoboxes protein 3-like n=1 Tax=Myxine glutinosa TaxID=7769 RepID=UPI0035901B87
MDLNKHLWSTFMKFPYPTKAEIDYLTVVTKFSEQDVTVWLAAQRLMNGISWAPEDVQLAREQSFVTRCVSKVAECRELSGSNMAGRHLAAKADRGSAGTSFQVPVPETFQNPPSRMHHSGHFDNLQSVKNDSPTLHAEQDPGTAHRRNATVIKAETPESPEYDDSSLSRCAHQDTKTHDVHLDCTRFKTDAHHMDDSETLHDVSKGSLYLLTQKVLKTAHGDFDIMQGVLTATQDSSHDGDPYESTQPENSVAMSQSISDIYGDNDGPSSDSHKMESNGLEYHDDCAAVSFSSIKLPPGQLCNAPFEGQLEKQTKKDGTGRVRQYKSRHQLEVLKASFESNAYPLSEEIQRLAEVTCLSIDSIGNYFYDRRKFFSKQSKKNGEGKSPVKNAKNISTIPANLVKNKGSPTSWKKKTPEQLIFLKSAFMKNPWPSFLLCKKLMKQTGLSHQTILRWFGDMRYSMKQHPLQKNDPPAGGHNKVQTSEEFLWSYLTQYGKLRKKDMSKLRRCTGLCTNEVRNWFRVARRNMKKTQQMNDIINDKDGKRSEGPPESVEHVYECGSEETKDGLLGNGLSALKVTESDVYSV